MIVEVVSNSQINRTFVEKTQTCFTWCTISQLYLFCAKKTNIYLVLLTIFEVFTKSKKMLSRRILIDCWYTLNFLESVCFIFRIQSSWKQSPWWQDFWNNYRYFSCFMHYHKLQTFWVPIFGQIEIWRYPLNPGQTVLLSDNDVNDISIQRGCNFFACNLPITFLYLVRGLSSIWS